MFVRDNHAGATTDRGRQDMAIIRVRKVQRRHELPVSSDEGIWSVLVHQLPRALQLCPCQIGSPLKQVRDPFFVNVVRPSRAKDAWNR